jgi:hypothetical protein
MSNKSATGGVAGEDERAREAREAGGQALGDAVGKILLFGIAAIFANGRTRRERRGAPAFLTLPMPASPR